MQSQSPRVSSVRDDCLPTVSLWTIPVWYVSIAFSRISFQLHCGSSVIFHVHRISSSRCDAMRSGRSPSDSSSGGASAANVQNTNPFHVSMRTGTRPFSTRSKPSASFMSGQPQSDPSSM